MATAAIGMHLSSEILKQCWFLAGPTAVGKSEVAVELARRIDAEIVSLDSMSMYRGMDIGTAKPSQRLRALVPHHLIDVIEPHDEFSVAQFVEAAGRSAEEIVARERDAAVCRRNRTLSAQPIARRLRRAAGRPGSAVRIGGRAAAATPGGSARDVSRRRSGVRDTDSIPTTSAGSFALWKSITARVNHFPQLQRQLPLPPEMRPENVFWLSPPRPWLYERINRRVEKMFAEGLLDEVARLLAAPNPLSRTARQALGYQEAIDHLEGRLSLAETIERIQTRTRQFAKRQHTWFRHLEECRAVEISGDETASELAERIASAGRPSIQR